MHFLLSISTANLDLCFQSSDFSIIWQYYFFPGIQSSPSLIILYLDTFLKKIFNMFTA